MNPARVEVPSGLFSILTPLGSWFRHPFGLVGPPIELRIFFCSLADLLGIEAGEWTAADPPLVDLRRWEGGVLATQGVGVQPGGCF